METASSSSAWPITVTSPMGDQGIGIIIVGEGYKNVTTDERLLEVKTATSAGGVEIAITGEGGKVVATDEVLITLAGRLA